MGMGVDNASFSSPIQFVLSCFSSTLMPQVIFVFVCFS